MSAPRAPQRPEDVPGPDEPGPHEAQAEARARGARRARRRTPKRRRKARARGLKARARKAAQALLARAKLLAARGWRRWSRTRPGALVRAVPLPVLLSLTAGLLLACYSMPPAATPPKAAPTTAAGPRIAKWRGVEPQVRVALVESAPVVSCVLPGPWRVLPDRGAEGALPGEGEVTVVATEPGIEVSSGGVRLAFPEATEVRFAPPRGDRGPGTVAVGTRRFHGEVVIHRLPGKPKEKDKEAVPPTLRLVNHVGLEDYLAGVVGHEMPLSWSDAALHAQAICARTYALASLRPQSDHDVKADERSQVYRGVMAEDARARAMVDATRGMVLVWSGDIFTTYFHSTCGGDTVPAKWIFGDADIEPLSGATGCRCQASRLYRWTETVDLAVAPGVRRWVLEAPLREVKVQHFPRGGYVETVTFVDAGGDVVTEKGTDVRSALKLKAPAFEARLEPDGHTLVVEGRGWGHGVGLCQFGANGFAKEGKDADWILAHFYPGSKIEALGY